MGKIHIEIYRQLNWLSGDVNYFWLISVVVTLIYERAKMQSRVLFVWTIYLAEIRKSNRWKSLVFNSDACTCICLDALKTNKDRRCQHISNITIEFSMQFKLFFVNFLKYLCVVLLHFDIKSKNFLFLPVKNEWKDSVQFDWIKQENQFSIWFVFEWTRKNFVRFWWRSRIKFSFSFFPLLLSFRFSFGFSAFALVCCWTIGNFSDPFVQVYNSIVK